MEMIDPEFDPTAGKRGMWFYGEHEANTLRLLLLKLGPKGTIGVNNFYPHPGCAVRYVPVSDEFPQGFILEKTVLPKSKAPAGIFIAKAKSRRPRAYTSRYDAIRDEVLDMWQAGASSRLIAEKFNITKINVAAHIVAPARERGDPRATPRCKPRGGSVLPPDHQQQGRL